MIVEVEKDKRSKKQKWIDHLEGQLSAEREKVAGYEQLAQVNSAYISILLKRLGATEDNKVDVPATEITEALEKYEARAIATENGFALYYSVPMEKVEGD